MCKELRKGERDRHGSYPQEVGIRTKYKPSQMMDYVEIDH